MTKGMVIRDPSYDHADYPAMDRMGQHMQTLGVQWVRLEFREGFDDAYDHFIRVVAPKYNLKILGLLGFGLTSIACTQLNERVYTTDPRFGGGCNAYMQVWLAAALRIAERYRGQVHAFEVLNEQNRLPMSDGPGLNVIHVARLHTKFYRLAKPLSPALIITGGLHPAGSNRPRSAENVTDLAYLTAMITSEAFMGYRRATGEWPADGIGYHPYPVEISVSNGTVNHNVMAQSTMMTRRLDGLRQFLRTHGNIPFWITEIGYNAGYGKNTAEGQAEAVRTWLPLLLKRSDVAQTFWFKYEDFPPAEGPNAQRWGVVRIPFDADGVYGDTYVEQPSYAALKGL
jgi:hypothetical protein